MRMIVVPTLGTMGAIARLGSPGPCVASRIDAITIPQTRDGKI